jgi:hypothetical protein
MQNRIYPPGWDEARIRRILTHYEEQTEKKRWQRMKRLLKVLIKPAWKFPAVPMVNEPIVKHKAQTVA